MGSLGLQSAAVEGASERQLHPSLRLPLVAAAEQVLRLPVRLLLQLLPLHARSQSSAGPAGLVEEEVVG